MFKSIELAPRRESEAERMARRAPDILKSLAKKSLKQKQLVGEIYVVKNGRYVLDHD